MVCSFRNSWNFSRGFTKKNTPMLELLPYATATSSNLKIQTWPQLSDLVPIKHIEKITQTGEMDPTIQSNHHPTLSNPPPDS